MINYKINDNNKYLPVEGGTLSGYLNMGGRLIKNVANPVDDSDQSGLTGSIGGQQTEDLPFRNLQADIIQGLLLAEGLADVLYLDNCHY